MHELFTRDQREGESADNWYALYRYVDRLFEPKRERTEEIATLDMSAMSVRAQYLLKHILILKRAYGDALAHYPNLCALELVGDIAEPIILRDPPRHSWRYLRERGIWL